MDRKKASKDENKRKIKLNPFYTSPKNELEFKTSNGNNIKDDVGFQIKVQKENNKDSKIESQEDYYYRKFKENQAKAKLLRAKYEAEVKSIKTQSKNSQIIN